MRLKDLQCTELTCKDPAGRVGRVLLHRGDSDRPHLELVEIGLVMPPGRRPTMVMPPSRRPILGRRLTMVMPPSRPTLVMPPGRRPTLGRRPTPNSLEARRPPKGEHRGWYSRGYLPHFDEPDLIQSITFRLADSVPASVIAAWKEELELKSAESAADPRCIELVRRIAKYEDAGRGACWLRDERIASIVENALLYFDGERYRLLAWCIMPNHVHVLSEMIRGYPLADVLHSWKSFTANEANRLLGRTGAFWQREYFDRFIRNERHLRMAIEYIENNPVKAGLARSPEEWRFGSAWHRSQQDADGPR